MAYFIDKINITNIGSVMEKVCFFGHETTVNVFFAINSDDTSGFIFICGF